MTTTEPSRLEPSPSPGRRRAIVATAVLLVVVVALALGELMIRIVQPQRSLYPRTQFSTGYGFLPLPETTMVNEVPGRWRFTYRTNAQSHRGTAPPISNRYVRPVVVVLGDSYTFGVGVDDGQEYAQGLRDRLAGRYDVANFGVEGWGLTQEIRRFYEVGQLYQPSVVVLQFCANDPSDNLLNPVTDVLEGRFVFRPAPGRYGVLKQYLSTSWLQRSQIYNLLRDVGFNLVRGREIVTQMRLGGAPPTAPGGGGPSVAPADELNHIRLLNVFAADLQRRGIRLVMFAVDGQLERFPTLRDAVRSMQQRGQLQYVEMMDGFPGGVIAKSPEGHWAPSVHQGVAALLAQAIEAQVPPAGVAGAAPK